MKKYNVDRKKINKQIAQYFISIFIIWFIAIVAMSKFLDRKYLPISMLFPISSFVYLPAYTRQYHYSLTVNEYGIDILNDLMAPKINLHWSDIEQIGISFNGILYFHTYSGQIIRLRKNIYEYEQVKNQILEIAKKHGVKI